MKYESKDLTEMSKVVRADALRAILTAESGHIGIVLGAANIITTVYANFMRAGVDKFVLSAGHGSALLYSVLNLSGHKIDDLESFRQIGGLPGHPEFGIHGVSATTGPLGQGVANAVGMALAHKINGSDAFVYCLCGDGDLSEGVAQEAIAFAGRYKLNNLVLLWDDNGLTIDGVAQTDMDIPSRMRAAGWHTDLVRADDFDAINRALNAVKRSRLPVFISCKSKLGNGSSIAGQARAHGYGLPIDEIQTLIQKNTSAYGYELWHKYAGDCDWTYNKIQKIDLPIIKLPTTSDVISTREMSGIYLNELIKNGVNLVCGSADLGGSTNVRTESSVDIVAGNYSGNYVNYGIREHAMAAIMNGMAVCDVRAVGSTFLVFSDYMRGAMRMSAMSGVPVIYILTHDSISVGEDGPTHQPIEQLPSLRMIPNMNVFRPCSRREIVWAWRRALSETRRPTSIILSRQKFKLPVTPREADINCGGYVILPSSTRRVRVTIIATGADVALAITVANKLGWGVQVVSMPSVADFREQSAEYKRKILRGFVVALESAASAPWFEFADAVVGINEFGVSGPADDVCKHFGFDADMIANDIKQKLK